MLCVRLKELRAEKNISQAQLAKLLHVSQQTVGKWETDTSTPNPETLVKIAEIFGITVDSLLGVNTEKKDPSEEGPFKDKYKGRLMQLAEQLSREEYHSLEGYAERILDERKLKNLHNE